MENYGYPKIIHYPFISVLSGALSTIMLQLHFLFSQLPWINLWSILFATFCIETAQHRSCFHWWVTFSVRMARVQFRVFLMLLLSHTELCSSSFLIEAFLLYNCKPWISACCSFLFPNILNFQFCLCLFCWKVGFACSCNCKSPVNVDIN